MILTDAGPLVAILDRGERHHQACVDCLAELTGPMLTTWPAFTEAMYLLGEAGGWVAQAALWSLQDKGDLLIVEQNAEDRGRMQALMEKYRDRPMDLADASLVALAESRRLRDIFTLDHSDFRVYRLHRRQTLRLWPERLTD
jgi:predicted nucleic acid-binding protein